MTHIDASQLDYRQLNAAIRDCTGDVAVTGCLGQRSSARGGGMTALPSRARRQCAGRLSGRRVHRGTRRRAGRRRRHHERRAHHRPRQHGDACGLCHAGGELYVAGNAGYRAGIHMKAYGDKLPVMVIGGRAGSFLGEYQAGGIIIVLGLTDGSRPIVSNFPCTGMHGGKLFLRSDCRDILFPGQVVARPAVQDELREIEPYLHTFCACSRALRCAPAPSVHRRHAQQQRSLPAAVCYKLNEE